MNCTTCRYELSQCLDGRLPSGRRTVVLEHASQCDACGAFWAELQAAQQLTLRLQKPRVSGEFREALWQRIQAGEGTPDAVFHEPVPLLAKLRYTLTGAAAAAAALLCVTWFGPTTEHQGLRPLAKLDTRSTETNSGTVIVGPPPPAGQVAFTQALPPVDAAPMLSATQRLSLNLVAREAAKQLDNRYASATYALRRFNDGRGEAIEDVLENANEFHGFGELLLDMRNSERLVFTDAEVEADLRFAVAMLGRSQNEPANEQTVRAIVEPALRRWRDVEVSKKISLVLIDPREEMDALRRLKLLRADIFPKMFAFFGSDAEIQRFGLIVPGTAFAIDDECGQNWVAPLSEIEAGDLRLRIIRSIGDRKEHIDIHRGPGRK